MADAAEKPDIDLDIAVDSPAIRRIIEEMKRDEAAGVHVNGYNRVYSRHNRS